MRRAAILVEFVFLSVATFLWLGTRENLFLSSSDQLIAQEVVSNAAYVDDFDWNKVRIANL